MEEKDIQKYKHMSSRNEDISVEANKLSEDLMLKLDFLSQSLDDLSNDFSKEISLIEKRAASKIQESNEDNKTSAEDFIERKSQVQGDNTLLNANKLDDKLIDNIVKPEKSSIEKAQELIDNISSSHIFDDNDYTSDAPIVFADNLIRNNPVEIVQEQEDAPVQTKEEKPVEEASKTQDVSNVQEETKVVETKNESELKLDEMVQSIKDRFEETSTQHIEKTSTVENKNKVDETKIEDIKKQTETKPTELKETVGKKGINLSSIFKKKKKAPKLKAVKVSAGGGNSGNGGNGTRLKKAKDSRPKGSKGVTALAIIACFVLFIGIVGGVGALWFANRLCINKPEFHAADLESADSSIIYDSKGNQVIELGLYLRENIEYEELPNCVIDAFVSIEDSRYFEHFGFDIPRFTKAIIENLKSGSFAQGGSTITMQLVKNSYFQVDNDEDSTMAARSGMSGVQRKMQEIVLAMEANQKLSKQEIFVLFLNKVNFGDNIRGIQKAAEYYFGKDARELSLNEAAFLAGIINAPNVCNPYNEIEKRSGTNAYLSEDINYLENANVRKNEVLDLMVYHGYISEDEAKLNKAVKIENLVVGKSKKFGNTNTYYQSYIDAVITEAQKVTDKNPYTTAMNIYTSMDPHMQEFVYDMQNNPEKFADKYVFRHDNQQNALVVMNNQTGELIALGGGRNQADEARQFNRAFDSYINPGSTIKPVIEYVLAFDKLGYATSHTVTDQPVFLYETDIVISNAYGQGYTGDMLISEALARSLNTPAVQLMTEVIDKIEEEGVIEYCQSIGLDWCNKDTFDVQWAIGGRDCLVSPVQLAGAHGMIIHGGKYIAPHCISKIEYRGKYNETPDYIADTEGKQVVSPAAAYMTSTLLKNNVDSGWIGQLNLLRRDYDTFAKTGTTNFSEAAYINYNIPETAAKDQWLCTQTSNYTVVVWNGFDKLEDNAYFTVTDENYNLKCKMGSILLDEIMNTFNYEAKSLTKPDDCIEIEHIKGSFPYAIGNSAKGLIKKDSPYATPIPESQIEKEKKGGTLYHTVVLDSGDGRATIHWDEFNAYLGGTIDMSVTSVSGKKTVIAYGRSFYPRYNFVNPGMFYATLTTGDGQEIAVESPNPTITVETGAPGPYSVCGWTATNPNPRCSTQQENSFIYGGAPSPEGSEEGNETE